jgi:hypothetical protein
MGPDTGQDDRTIKIIENVSVTTHRFRNSIYGAFGKSRISWNTICESSLDEAYCRSGMLRLKARRLQFITTIIFL